MPEQAEGKQCRRAPSERLHAFQAIDRSGPRVDPLEGFITIARLRAPPPGCNGLKSGISKPHAMKLKIHADLEAYVL